MSAVETRDFYEKIVKEGYARVGKFGVGLVTVEKAGDGYVLTAETSDVYIKVCGDRIEYRQTNEWEGTITVYDGNTVLANLTFINTDAGPMARLTLYGRGIEIVHKIRLEIPR